MMCMLCTCEQAQDHVLLNDYNFNLGLYHPTQNYPRIQWVGFIRRKSCVLEGHTFTSHILKKFIILLAEDK